MYIWICKSEASLSLSPYLVASTLPGAATSVGGGACAGAGTEVVLVTKGSSVTSKTCCVGSEPERGRFAERAPEVPDEELRRRAASGDLSRE